jgi:hypothetical protein
MGFDPLAVLLLRIPGYVRQTDMDERIFAFRAGP